MRTRRFVAVVAFACAALLAVAARAQVVTALPMSETAVLGRFARGPVDLPVLVNASEFQARFSSAAPAQWPAELQVRQFFANGGTSLWVVRASGEGGLATALAGRASDRSGVHALTVLSNLRLLVAPELSQVAAGEFGGLLQVFRSFVEPRRIFLILDPPPGLANAAAAVNWVQGSVPTDAAFCAIYFPPLQVLVDGVTQTVPASGSMAAVYTKRDAATGIWRSPAGTTNPIVAQGVSAALTTQESDLLTTNNINAVRVLSGQVVPWAARTLDRADAENRFLAVVRTRGWVAASVERGMAFAASADNGEPLWAQLRGAVGDFLFSLYQQGAFVGSSPSTSYFVRCDATTTSAADVAAHRVNVLYGMALLTPSEFLLTRVGGATFDPAREVPRPVLQPRALEGGQLLLPYPTVAGFNYQLETRVGLGSGDWMAVRTGVAGDGAWRLPAVPVTGGSGFWRVKITSAR